MPVQTTTILLADDDPVTRYALQWALTDMGYDVRQACDGTEGCALIEEMKSDCPQLLITDLDMPGCCGEELAQFARQHFEQIKLLFTSGTPQASLLKSIATDRHALFLQKPFLRADLRAAMEQLGVA